MRSIVAVVRLRVLRTVKRVASSVVSQRSPSMRARSARTEEMKLPPTRGVVHAGRSSGCALRTAQPVGQPGHVGAARLPSDLRPGHHDRVGCALSDRVEGQLDTQRNRLAGGAVEDPDDVTAVRGERCGVDGSV